MNEQLKKALHFAGEAGDIESLKSLAQQEAKRADDAMLALVAVLISIGRTATNRPGFYSALVSREAQERAGRARLTLMHDPVDKSTSFGVDCEP